MGTERIKKLVIFAVAAFVLWLIMKYVFPVFLPFIIAWIAACCLQPAVTLLSERLKTSKRLVAGIFVTLTVSGIGAVVFLTVSRALSELGALLSDLNTNGGAELFLKKAETFVSHIPFISAYGNDISDVLKDALMGALTELTATLPALVASAVGALPELILFTVILITSSYYFTADHANISKKLRKLLPPSLRCAYDRMRRRLATAGLQYLKACLILTFITFVELTVGLLTLGIPYAFTLALVISLVDMLPILGAGTVLVPWAIWEWVIGDVYYAVGILIIFAVVSLVRRFAEPRIISSGIGLSPITTLFSMYLGSRVFGIMGLFFAPLLTVILLNALPDGIAETLGLRFRSTPDNSTSESTAHR